MEIKFLDSELKTFAPATDLAAGYDLRSMIDVKINPGETVKIPTGVAIHMQDECYAPAIPCAVIMPRSGLGCKGIRPRNTPGLIDADYQGEIVVCLYNGSPDWLTVNRMDRIAQLVFMFAIHPELHVVSEFSQTTARGTGGFGSTGKA